MSSLSRRFERLTLLIPAAYLVCACDKPPPNQPICPFSGTRAVRKPINLLKNFCRRLLRLALKPSEAQRLLTTTPKTCLALGAAYLGGFPSDVWGNAVDSNISAFLIPNNRPATCSRLLEYCYTKVRQDAQPYICEYPVDLLGRSSTQQSALSVRSQIP